MKMEKVDTNFLMSIINNYNILHKSMNVELSYCLSFIPQQFNDLRWSFGVLLSALPRSFIKWNGSDEGLAAVRGWRCCVYPILQRHFSNFKWRQ